eukprot:m.145253 g.145253  ORF g.145253 m.145253 type:complete len:101 (+) comp52675_c1_seq9:2639-2941(+)
MTFHLLELTEVLIRDVSGISKSRPSKSAVPEALRKQLLAQFDVVILGESWLDLKRDKSRQLWRSSQVSNRRNLTVDGAHNNRWPGSLLKLSYFKLGSRSK